MSLIERPKTEAYKQPWIKWDGISPPGYVHLIAYEILLRDGSVRFCDVGCAVMWENFGGPSDIDSWRPYSGLKAPKETK